MRASTDACCDRKMVRSFSSVTVSICRPRKCVGLSMKSTNIFCLCLSRFLKSSSTLSDALKNMKSSTYRPMYTGGSPSMMFP
eukprot:8074825-Ditylum_brightwellii.AAC.1